MRKANLFLSFTLAIITSSASAYMVNTLSNEEKNNLAHLGVPADETQPLDKLLQTALSKNIQGSDLQITHYNERGALASLFVSNKISFQFNDKIPGTVVKFDCYLTAQHGSDLLVYDCAGKSKDLNGVEKSVSLATFNTLSANNSAQSSIKIKNILRNEYNDTYKHCAADPACLKTLRESKSAEPLDMGAPQGSGTATDGSK